MANKVSSLCANDFPLPNSSFSRASLNKHKDKSGSKGNICIISKIS